MQPIVVVASAAIFMLVSLPLFAQDPAQQIRIPLLEHGPEHDKLNFLIGDWRGKTDRYVPELQFESRVNYSWEYGGAWLVEKELVDLPNTGTIWNIVTIAYGSKKKSWTGAYWDNVSPAMIPLTVTWKDDRTLVFDSGDIQFGGRAHRVMTTLTRLADCRLRREMVWSWDHGEFEKVLTSDMKKQGC